MAKGSPQGELTGGPAPHGSASERSEQRAARDAKRRQPLRARSRLLDRDPAAHHRAPVGRRRMHAGTCRACSWYLSPPAGKASAVPPRAGSEVAGRVWLSRTRIRASSDEVPPAASPCERGAQGRLRPRVTDRRRFVHRHAAAPGLAGTRGSSSHRTDLRDPCQETLTDDTPAKSREAGSPRSSVPASLRVLCKRQGSRMHRQGALR